MSTFLKGIGALIYSLIHAWLINLVVIGVLYIAFQIFSLSWFWIIIIFIFLWGAIEMFRDLILGIIALPYAWLTRDGSKALILPGIYLIINALWLIYRIWSSNEIEGTIVIIACVFATYEIVMLTCKSIYAMIAISSNE